MTSNQINLIKSREERRHNKVTEKETQRMNRNVHRVSMLNLAETNRRNLAQEQLDRDKLKESVRHNKASEDFNYAQFEGGLAETKRHNLATEYQNQLNYGLEKQRVYHTGLQTEISKFAAETSRLAQIESARHNVVSESLQAQLNNQNYELATRSNALKQMDITQSSLLKFKTFQEQQRHNVAMENEANRHNVATEDSEQVRNSTHIITNLSDQTNKWFKSITGR